MFFRKNVRFVYLFILVFFLTFCYSMFFTETISDEIWSYGFSFNFFSGLIPYKDFNMILTPLFSVIGGLFIKLFGDYLFSVHIFGALYISIIMLFLFKILGKKSFICYVFLLIYFYPTYNTFSWLFIFSILYLVYFNKDDDISLGLLISFCFLTKQTIGIALFIPYIFNAKNKKVAISIFLVPIVCFIMYLIYHGAFYDFIDQCFLGMFTFGEKNSVYTFLILELLIIFYLLKKLLDSKFRDKACFYILMFQVLSFPICDAPHFFYAFVPVMYFLLREYGNSPSKKIQHNLLYISAFGIFFLLFSLNLEFFIVKDKNNFMYLRNANLDIMELESQFSIIDEYVEKFDNQFYILDTAYFFKLSRGDKINKFDLLNNGNMGYNGEQRYINEIDSICSNNSCVFFVAHWYYDGIEGQLSEKIFNHVINNYQLYAEEKYFHVYTN